MRLCGENFVYTDQKKWMLYLCATMTLVSTGYLFYDCLNTVLITMSTENAPIFPAIIGYINIGICFLGFILNLFVFFAVKFGSDAKRSHLFVLFYIIYEFYVFIISFIIIILLIIALVEHPKYGIYLAVAVPIFNISSVAVAFFIPFYRMLKKKRGMTHADAPSMLTTVVHPVFIEPPAPAYEMDAPPAYSKIYENVVVE